MKRITLICALICLSMTHQATAQTNNTFFLGHSLINFQIPNIVNKLSIAGSQAFAYDANIGNGATLAWHWTNPATGGGDQWDLTLPNGGYENFIITEAVPLENHLQFSNTYRYADSLYRFAEQYNPNVQYYIYETWHCTNSGNGSTSGSGGTPCDWDPNSTTPWRDRLDIDLPRWESIADSINLIHTNPMLVIPGGQAMARLSDNIENGTVPGLTSITDLFVDTYHLDDRGNYFIACVMYGVIHGTSPVGLPNHLTDEYGNLYTDFPTPDQAAIMQDIAWQTICEYQHDGVDCSPASISENADSKSNISLYPIPTKDELTVKFDAFKVRTPFTIFDQLGKVIRSGDLTSKTSKLDVTDLPSGVYILNIEGQTLRFIK